MIQTRFFSHAVAVALVVFLASQYGYSQSPDVQDKRFEIGGHFTMINVSTTRTVALSPVPCFVPPCPFAVTVGRSNETDFGFGGRFGYNLTSNVALEAEVNFFPGDDTFVQQGGAFNISGHKTQGLFGVRAGKRFDKLGIFGKARPGFWKDSKGALQTAPSGCPAVFPPPIGCFDPVSKTSFALDLGGVFEFYPTKRTIIRVDAGDTIVRLTERNAAGFLVPSGGGSSLSFLAGVRLPNETTHNFQVSIGAGFRF